MKEFTYRIEDENGMHARPAGMLANFAKQFEADITVTANGKTANAKRVLSLMTLGATHQTLLTFQIEGADEEIAYQKLAEFCNNGMKPSDNQKEKEAKA